MNRQLKLTEDGSYTLYLPEIDETYHSVHGAVNESLHVFIHAGFDLCEKEEANIFEIGFGMGLNAYLTALAAEAANKIVHYTSIEKYPLEEDIWEQLNFAGTDESKQTLFEKIHRAEWEKEICITENFYLQKIQADFCNLDLVNDFDLIYYDAFSPEKQPELWTEDIFQKLYQHTKPKGILTTYCAKGSVRRAMQAAGFTVKRIPGPKGKREMLLARKVASRTSATEH